MKKLSRIDLVKKAEVLKASEMKLIVGGYSVDAPCGQCLCLVTIYSEEVSIGTKSNQLECQEACLNKYPEEFRSYNCIDK